MRAIPEHVRGVSCIRATQIDITFTLYRSRCNVTVVYGILVDETKNDELNTDAVHSNSTTTSLGDEYTLHYGFSFASCPVILNCRQSHTASFYHYRYCMMITWDCRNGMGTGNFFVG